MTDDRGEKSVHMENVHNLGRDRLYLSSHLSTPFIKLLEGNEQIYPNLSESARRDIESATQRLNSQDFNTPIEFVSQDSNQAIASLLRMRQLPFMIIGTNISPTDDLQKPRELNAQQVVADLITCFHPETQDPYQFRVSHIKYTMGGVDNTTIIILNLHRLPYEEQKKLMRELHSLKGMPVFVSSTQPIPEVKHKIFGIEF